MEEVGEKAGQSVTAVKMVRLLFPFGKLLSNWWLYQNKEKGGLESLQEVDNQDPGVNSDDEDDELKV